MKSYFKYIGYFFLLLWLVGLFAYLINFAEAAKVTIYKIGNSEMKVGGLNAAGYFYYVMMLIVYLVTGPVIGLLCISHSGLLEKDKVVDRLVEHDEVMQEEIKVAEKAAKLAEEKKKEASVVKGQGYKIDGNLITVNGRLHRVSELSNVKIDGLKVSFSFHAIQYMIECKDEKEAENLYKTLVNKK